MTKDQIIFNIKEVAQQIGVTAATIRNWEKNRLFTARRNESNYRIYTLEDIQVLKRIKHFSVDQKLNHHSVKKMIEHEFSLSEPDVFHTDNEEKNTLSKKLLSRKWKEEREEKGLTLEQVSQETGISVSYLSKIENGFANASLEMLKKLSEYYGESLLFFYDEEGSEEKYKVSEDERVPLDIGLPGVYIESLIQRKNTILRPTIFTVLPKSGQEKTHSHRGEEFVYILKGSVVFILNNNERIELSTGDSLNFKSSTPHKWCNESNKKATLLWVHSPLNSDII